MRIVAATTDEEMLHTIIGAQILGGTMDYRGFSNMKGFEQFRAACRAGDVQYPDIPAVYVDTGLEYPELRDFVKTKDNVIWLRPRYPFTQILEKYGYPIISKEVSDVINGARKGQPYGKSHGKAVRQLAGTEFR